MTSADPSGPARRAGDEGRMPSPPPPLYQPSDEISLDDPILQPTDDAPAVDRASSSFDGPEPVGTPTQPYQRVARPFRGFWLSFAANASGIGIVVGALLFSSGMSLRQAIIAAAIGVLLAGLLLVAVERIGRRSGVPVTASSASVFGPRGNLLPVAIVLVARIVFGALLLWVLASTLAGIAQLAGIVGDGPLPAVVIVALGGVVSGFVAATGYRGIVRVHRILTPLAAAAMLWFVLVTLPSVDLRVALTIGDGPGYLVVSGAVTVFVLAGLLLLPAGGDVARFQDTGSSGPITGLWTTLGAAIPALITVGYGTMLAAGAPESAADLLASPVDAVAAVLPAWYPVPLTIAIIVGTVSGVALSLYSASVTAAGTVGATGRVAAVFAACAATAVVGILLVIAPGSTAIDLTTTVAVPLAAWAGVMVGRSLGHDAPALPGEERPQIRWLPTVSLLVSTAIGLGLTSATTAWLSWQGFLLPLLGARPDDALASSDPGILVALLLAALASILRPRVATQQRGRGTHRRP